MTSHLFILACHLLNLNSVSRVLSTSVSPSTNCKAWVAGSNDRMISLILFCLTNCVQGQLANLVRSLVMNLTRALMMFSFLLMLESRSMNLALSASVLKLMLLELMVYDMFLNDSCLL